MRRFTGGHGAYGAGQQLQHSDREAAGTLGVSMLEVAGGGRSQPGPSKRLVRSSLTLGGGEVTLLDNSAYHTWLTGVSTPPIQCRCDSRAYIGRATNANRFRRWRRNFLGDRYLERHQARTPAFGRIASCLSRPAAAKTGTTSDIGTTVTPYTRYLVAGVWAGNSDGAGDAERQRRHRAAVWHDFMEAVLASPLAELDAEARAGPSSRRQCHRTDCPPGCPA